MHRVGGVARSGLESRPRIKRFAYCSTCASSSSRVLSLRESSTISVMPCKGRDRRRERGASFRRFWQSCLVNPYGLDGLNLQVPATVRKVHEDGYTWVLRNEHAGSPRILRASDVAELHLGDPILAARDHIAKAQYPELGEVDRRAGDGPDFHTAHRQQTIGGLTLVRLKVLRFLGGQDSGQGIASGPRGPSRAQKQLTLKSAVRRRHSESGLPALGRSFENGEMTTALFTLRAGGRLATPHE